LVLTRNLSTMVATRPKNIPELLWWRTYSNLFYLLFSFPLGLLYFLIILIGFVLGTTLAVLVVGIPILLFTVLSVWNFAALERSLALFFTGIEIIAPRDTLPAAPLARGRALIAKGYFWKISFFFLFKWILDALVFAATLVVWTPGFALLSVPFWTKNTDVVIGLWRGDLNTIQTLALALVGLGMTMIAARITNITAPMVVQITAYVLTDNQIENTNQKARLEALSLASSTATLASSLSVTGKFDATLTMVLENAMAALGANAVVLMLESRRISVGFSPHAVNALLEIGAIEAETPQWRKIPFEQGYVVRPKKRNDAIWQALAIMPLTQRKARLIMRFEDSIPRQAELEFLATIANQFSVALENARLIAVAQSQAALEERHRLARELHDSVSQALFGIALGARTAKAQLERDPEKANEPLDYVLQLAEAAVTEMRALIFELRPEILEKEGLIAALTKQAEMMRLRYKLEMETVLDTEPNLPLSTKQTLLRIAQEALHNTVKHAKASSARLEFRASTLIISDNGIGFDTTQSFSSSLGQRTMRERAEAIGATYSLESNLDSGTRICVILSS
jgi:signal transduction histidine kinase